MPGDQYLGLRGLLGEEEGENKKNLVEGSWFKGSRFTGQERGLGLAFVSQKKTEVNTTSTTNSLG